MKLIEVCNECKKPLKIRHDYSKFGFEIYECGHLAFLDQPKAKLEQVEYHDLNGESEAYDYQKIGYEFAAQTDFNCLISDAMGLGKTIQALLCVKNHPEELLPVLIAAKGTTIGNWMREIYKWCDKEPTTWTIIGKQPYIPAGFKYYIVSYDSLRVNYEQLKQLHETRQAFKSVIVDEAHAFKDDSSKRTKSLIHFLTGSKADTSKVITGGKFHEGEVKTELKPIKHRIFLTGTPIKNTADEYFVTLNLLRPKEFYSRKSFRDNWLEQDEKGRWSKVRPQFMGQFQKRIEPFVIRREKTQVLKNLPAFARNFEFITIEDKDVKNSYNRELGLAESMMAKNEFNGIALLGWLQRMRRLTGVAKIEAAIDWTQEFFESTELEKMTDPNYPDKLAIGIHHQAVRDSLKIAFDARDIILESQNGNGSRTKFNCLKLSGEDNAWKKDDIVKDFAKPEHKLLIINELAGGVGLNLQMCANTLILERQWNSADEEQFESRFHRNGQTYPVTATYLLAQGTIDEFFHDMIEEKRHIFGRTISDWAFTQDVESMKSLVERAIQNPLR
jgi:SNF2 family DNA or RNA helicase